MPVNVPPRNQVDKAWTWNAESVFPNHDTWQTEQQALADALSSLEHFQGHLADGPHKLAEYFTASERGIFHCFRTTLPADSQTLLLRSYASGV